MSLKPVVLSFLVKGMPDVQRAVRNVSDAVIGIERRTSSAIRREASQRIREAEREAAAKVAAYQRAERLASSARGAGAKREAAALRAEANELGRAAAAKLAALEKLQGLEQRARAKKLDRAASSMGLPGLSTLYGSADGHAAGAGGRGPKVATGFTEAKKEREFQGLVRETERWTRDAAREKANAEKQAAKDTVEAWKSAQRTEVAARREGEREAARIARSKARDEARVEREKDHNAMRWVRQREREIAKEKKNAEKEAEAKRSGFRRTIAGAAGSAVGAGVGMGARVAHGLLGMGGGVSIEGALNEEMSLSGQAAGIVASSDTKRTASDLLGQARSVATSEGLDTSEVLSGIDEIKKLSGDLETALKVLPDIAKVANATGGNVGELGGLAGNLIAANPELAKDPGKLMKQVRLFTQQGIVGGVEVADMAKYGGRLTAGAQLFGGDLEANEGTLGAFAQIARQKGGAASAAEAAMGAQRFATDVAAKHDKLKKLKNDQFKDGIETSDGHGKLRDPMEIMLDMLSFSGGDVTKFKQLGLGERGIKPLTGAADTYKKEHDKKLTELAKDKSLSKAEREKRADAAGRAAVKQEIFKFSNKDKDGKEILTAESIEAKAKIRRAQLDRQLTMAMTKLKGEIAEKLYPELVKLVPHLQRAIPWFALLVDKLAGFVEWAEKNPFSGFATIVGAFFMKELAAAQIGKLIEGALSGGGAGGAAGKMASGALAGPGAGAGVLGKVGAAAAVVTAGVAAGYATHEWVSEGFDEEKKKDAGQLGNRIEAANLAARAARGGLSGPELQRAQELTGKLRADADKQADELDPMKRSTVKQVTGAAGAAVGGIQKLFTGQDSFSEAQEVGEREQYRAMKETQDALAKLVGALEKNTAVTAAANKAGAGGGGGGGEGGAAPIANPAAPARLGPIASPARSGR